MPDTTTGWTTDRRSQYDFDFDFAGVRRQSLTLSIGPSWVGSTWRRRKNPVSETSYFKYTDCVWRCLLRAKYIFIIYNYTFLGTRFISWSCQWKKNIWAYITDTHDFLSYVHVSRHRDVRKRRILFHLSQLLSTICKAYVSSEMFASRGYYFIYLSCFPLFVMHMWPRKLPYFSLQNASVDIG
jgi:hypothetical protein